MSPKEEIPRAVAVLEGEDLSMTGLGTEPTAHAGKAAVRPRPMTATAVCTASGIEVLYVEQRTLLMYIACRRFRVPREDAEGLIQDVFLSLIRNVGSVSNTRSWLVASMCNASRHYWRVEHRKEQLPDGFDPIAPGSERLIDDVALTLTLRQAIGYLRPRCRETLRLHYYEGRTAGDVANELETTPRYAEKLIHKCLKQVREIYKMIMRSRG